ncbi:farnesyl diphosphate synthase [Multifurca ochricompacta]|uniref:(2E,6E)-farnesyl diphosphate synthase n=1 Tax=Multifurca ochricompacta TaxID=376703 RepID=A0AAD4LZH2_9AGAM|nr:farnesyl diphosphate synthase [Multifurca ochricompacta]
MDKKAAVRERFMKVYDVVRDDLLADFGQHNMPEEAIKYYRESMDYNVPKGKLNRGLSVIDSVAILKGRELTEEEFFKAAVLGWSVEWLQAYFLVSDDIMDNSITRRGQPCWYKLPNVGLMAVNDALILEGAIFQMIRKHFRKEPYYVDLIDLMHEVGYQTEMGQLVDLITAPEDNVDLSKFSPERHELIVTYKTAIYSFYLPVALALILCGFPVEKKDESDTDYYKIAYDILIPLGIYFQIQDDYLDYSGTPEQIGKIGTDIKDNKCSWCINTALKYANDQQRATLEANYGIKDDVAEARVKEVFRAVGVDKYYAEYEAASYEEINALIDKTPEAVSPCGGAVLRRSVFRVFLEKIYKRTK